MESKNQHNLELELYQMKKLEDELRLAGYPPALIKACFDDFMYSLSLKNGDRYAFAKATPINKVWVHITDNTTLREYYKDGYRPMSDRGVYVRVSEIVTAEDAPFGS